MTIERILLGIVGAVILFVALAVIVALLEDAQYKKVHSRPKPSTRAPLQRPKGPAPEPPPEYPVFEGQSMLVDSECVYCGRNNRPGARECKGCGASMEGKVRTPKPEAPPSQDSIR